MNHEADTPAQRSCTLWARLWWCSVMMPTYLICHPLWFPEKQEKGLCNCCSHTHDKVSMLCWTEIVIRLISFLIGISAIHWDERTSSCNSVTFNSVTLNSCAFIGTFFGYWQEVGWLSNFLQVWCTPSCSLKLTPPCHNRLPSSHVTAVWRKLKAWWK